MSLSRHFPRFSGGIYPEGGSETTRHSERSEESHRITDRAYTFHFGRGIFRCAQYDGLFIVFASVAKHTPGRVNFRKAYTLSLCSWDISLSLNMTYFLSPIGALRHFAYAADAPLLSLSRHLPRFIGGVYPEGGSKICHCEEA